jgi:hypothetical protein
MAKVRAAKFAAETRRREALNRLATGQLTMVGLLAVSAIDDAVANLTVAKALRALGFGPVKIRQITMRANVGADRRLAYLSQGKCQARAERFCRAVVAARDRRDLLPPSWPMFGRARWLEQTPPVR